MTVVAAAEDLDQMSLETAEAMGMKVQDILDNMKGSFSWQSIVYLGLLLFVFLLLLIYAARWQKSFNVYYTLIFTIVPVAVLGCFFRSVSKTAEEAFMAQKIVYIGGCFLVYFITLAILDLCSFSVPKIVRTVTLLINSLLFLSIQTTEYTGLFYTKYGITKVNSGVYLTRSYGPLHTVYMTVLIIYFVVTYLAVLYALFFKKNVPKKRAILLLIMDSICLAAYFVEKSIDINLALSVLSYAFAEIVLLIIVRKIAIYSIRDTVADSIVAVSHDGYISFDKRFRYLGCLGNAQDVFPELKKTRVDKKATKDEFLRTELYPLINDFRVNGFTIPQNIKRGETSYLLSVIPLFNGKRRSGYQIKIVDDTADRKQIDMLDKFNDYLQEKVEEKTKDIKAMHDNLILSMATVVESRDNSTGGHIRRTSDCVRILIEEMKKDPECEVVKDELFCKNIIKAAPMHDLGKIAVPDAILQKPGRFEDWEFEKMKAHAAEGVRIVHEILKDLDKSDNKEYRAFHKLAENVAHYHHERMDGSGYPEGLIGDQIPIEARIMAIADVYDALVSKRVYKERMSFEKADGIMMDSFGKHFDPELEKYYVAARPRLEAYYLAEDE